MSEQTPAAVAAYFEALGRGDVPAAMGLLDPQVVWHQPGTNQYSGDHVGLDGVGALLGGMMQASEGSFELTVTGPATSTSASNPQVPSSCTSNRFQERPAVDLGHVHSRKHPQPTAKTSSSAPQDVPLMAPGPSVDLPR